MEKQSVKEEMNVNEELKKRGFKQAPSDRIITVDELMELLIHNYNVIMKEMHDYSHPHTDPR